MAHRTPKDDSREPDAWRRFEQAVDVALHTPPKHRESKPKPAEPKGKD